MFLNIEQNYNLGKLGIELIYINIIIIICIINFIKLMNFFLFYHKISKLINNIFSPIF